jgi:hypothetical protein
MEGLTDEEEDLVFEIELEIFSIATTTLLEEMVLLLNVKMSKIKSTEESNPKQGTLDQIVVKVVPSIVKSEDFCVKPKVSLEDKVYPKTYYHHS